MRNSTLEQNLFDEVRKLRNKLAHGSGAFDSAELAKHLSEMGLSIPIADLPEFTALLLQGFGREAGLYYVPQPILTVLSKLLDGKSASIVCDPWARMGTVLASVCESTQATKALAFTKNKNEAALGCVLLSSADWHVGDPCQLLSSLPANLDVVASVLPFSVRGLEPIEVQASDGTTLTLQDDLGHLILAASSMKLSANGLGMFVVPQSFFISHKSVLRKFDTLGLGITAALALPSGAFAPYANISTYLVVVGKQPLSRVFVAQLSTDANTNLQVIENFEQGLEGASLEFGRFVDITTFTGIDVLRTFERLVQAKRRFGYPAVRLEDLATAVTLGRPGNDFAFPKYENAIFLPLIGISDVVDSIDDTTLKHQNYAQVAIDPTRSDARFVARFLNSEFGKEIRECNKSGTIIPKLNTQSLKSIEVFVPDLQTQRDMLVTEARIITEQNTVLGLQNEIAECRRELWANPHSQSDVSRRLDAFSSRLSGELKQRTVERLDQWFETLPFPMASILRAWQATPSDDFKTKYEHLLHFFEASAEFVGIILLSAFSSREQVFQAIKKDLAGALKKQNLSFRKATFGTWKLVIEYLGKQVRQLMSGDKDQRAICADMFADQSIQLPEVLSCKELAEIVSVTNKLRNDWAGHGGVVGQEEANLRNERILSEVQNFREATCALWSDVQLVHSLHCRPRRGSFENEVAVLMGSNSEFLKETIAMPTWLDVERLYLVRKDGGQALQLLPLVQVGPSPLSAKNACYFFNRIERDGLRYVSYHFIDQPERKCSIEDAREVISLLQDNGEI
jgi:hypothetical protein